MSWAQITMEASSSEEDANAMQAHTPRQNTGKQPIIMIASPHPTVLTGNYDGEVQMGASLTPPPPGSPLHSASSATMFITGSSAPPTNIPVQQTPSGNLALAADIQMTSPSATLLQSFPAGSKIQGLMSPTTQQSPSPSKKGRDFVVFHADMESQDSNSRSSGSLTAMAVADLSGTQNQAKKKTKRRASGSMTRRGSWQDDALARALVESLGRTPAASPSASSLCRNQRRASHTDGALAQDLVASIAGTAGSPGSTSSMTAVLSATSAGALSPQSPPQEGAGQMNLELSLPDSPDPTLDTLTCTIVQGPNDATM